MSDRVVDTIAATKAIKTPARCVFRIGLFRFSGVGIFTQKLHIAGHALKYKCRLTRTDVRDSLMPPPRRGPWCRKS
jgi:hypothetical protein